MFSESEVIILFVPCAGRCGRDLGHCHAPQQEGCSAFQALGMGRHHGFRSKKQPENDCEIIYFQYIICLSIY